MLPLVLGCAGPSLDERERSFFKNADPWGFVLFARNCVDPPQTTRLINELRYSVGRSAPVFIDQEGGRVQRLNSENWRDIPSASSLGQIHKRAPVQARRAVMINSQLIAQDLFALGITGNFSPVLDIRVPETHAAIADRTFGDDPESVSEIGRLVSDAHLDQGVLPVIKHMPGQGRASRDSHRELPRVETPLADLSASDFVPFRRLNDMPAALVGHVVYGAIDPTHPATTSSKIIERVIRQEIGFKGLLFSDDVGMDALQGPVELRARNVLSTGCDMALFCAPDLDLAEKIAATVPQIGTDSLTRAEAALSRLTKPAILDEEELRAELNLLLTTLA